MALEELPNSSNGTQNVQQVAQALLQALLNAAGLPGPLAGMGANLGANMLFGGSPLAGATLFSQGTPGGSFIAQQYTFRDQMRSSVADAAANRVRRQTLIGAYNLANPDAAGDPNRAAAFADNIMGKWGYGLVHGMVDSSIGLDYSSDIGNYMGMFAAKQAQNAFRRGRVGWLAEPRSIAEQFFGDGAYDPARFGGQSQRSAAVLAAHIGNDIDFTGSGDPRAAADRLRDKVAQYGEALDSLKDLFGDDMPKIIQAVEQIGGNTLGNLGARNVHMLAQQLSADVLSGNYSMEKFASLDAGMKSAMAGVRGMPLSWYTTHASAARAALNMTSGNNTPYFMEQEQFNALAGRLASSPELSVQGNDFVKAFSIWQDNERRADSNADVSLAAFRARMGGNASLEKAIELAGVGNRFGLSRAYALSNYQTNLKSGVGMELARDDYLDYRMRRVAFANGRNTDLLDRLQLGRDENGRRALEGYTALMKDVMLTDEGVNVLNADPEERAELLFRAMRANGLDKDAGGNQLSDDALRNRAEALNTVITYNANDERTAEDMAAMQAYANEQSAARASQRVARMTRAAADLDIEFANPKGGGWASLLDSGTFTAEGIEAAMNKSAVIASNMDLYKGTVTSALQAAETLAGDTSSPGWMDRRNAAAKRLARYAVSVEGQSNSAFMDALKMYGAEGSDKQVWANVADLASRPGLEKSLAAYLGDSGDAGYAQRARDLSDAMSRARTVGGDNADMADVLRVTDYRNKINRAREQETDDRKRRALGVLDNEIWSEADSLDDESGRRDNHVTSANLLKVVRKKSAALEMKGSRRTEDEEQQFQALKERERQLQDSSKDTNELNMSNFGEKLFRYLADILNAQKPSEAEKTDDDRGTTLQQELVNKINRRH